MSNEELVRRVLQLEEDLRREREKSFSLKAGCIAFFVISLASIVILGFYGN